jgi:hypothetical protein
LKGADVRPYAAELLALALKLDKQASEVANVGDPADTANPTDAVVDVGGDSGDKSGCSVANAAGKPAASETAAPTGPAASMGQLPAIPMSTAVLLGAALVGMAAIVWMRNR